MVGMCYMRLGGCAWGKSWLTCADMMLLLGPAGLKLI